MSRSFCLACKGELHEESIVSCHTCKKMWMPMGTNPNIEVNRLRAALEYAKEALDSMSKQFLDNPSKKNPFYNYVNETIDKISRIEIGEDSGAL